MKPAVWVGLTVIVAAMAFASRAFVTNLTPYVSFEQARKAQGNVQAIGKLDKTSISHGQGNLLNFVIVDDEGDRLPVSYAGPRAPNFEQAVQITAIGRYDGEVFQAKNLLVKCPTKYQGTEVKEYSATAPGAASGVSPSTLSGVEAALRKETTR